jgi:hypothetical protein
VSLYLVGCSPEPFFAVFLIGLSELNFLAFFFEFEETGGELVSLVGQLSHLAEEYDVSEVEATVLMVV